MKSTILLLTSAWAVASCTQQVKENTPPPAPQEKTIDKAPTKIDTTTSFDLASIPYSESDIGVFPFFTPPKGYKEMNQPIKKDFDVCYFAVNGVMKPFEGRLYKANITNEQGTQFSQRYFEKSMEDYLASIGAVKVFDGTITREEYDRYNKQDPHKGDEGDIGYADEQIRVYVIKTKDQGNIFIQYTCTNAGAKLNILQENDFKQTIKKITADEITKDLSETGKSIVYITFDTDKSSITTAGIDLVIQIAEALKNDPSLKIAIEGHTDNIGDAAHNKKLSNDRAKAVMDALIAQKIDKSRLSAKGYGADRPLVANDSEDNRSKNRRVELVKIK